MEIQEINTIQNLLTQVNIISNHYNKIATLTGENFNIFSIMSMEKSEVYTHSAIICELLNPHGSHGQGDIFLDLFIDEINKQIETVNKIPYLKNSTTYKEFTIRETIKDKPSGGKIDIYISNNDKCIIIENKIDAPSQPNQLLRYYNYANNKYDKTEDDKIHNNFWLLYLQKQKINHIPSDLNYSCGNSKETIEKIIKITYEDEILNWLKECLKHAANLPIIRETINQYIFLINKIINKSNNNLMSEDLLELITSSKENIKSALEIQKQDIEKELINIFCKNLETEAEKIGLKFMKFGSLMAVDDCFTFYKENWNYAITFLFQENAMSKLCVGISLKQNGVTHNPNDEFNQMIRERLGYENIDDTWCGWENLDDMLFIPWEDFTNDKPVNDIMKQVKYIYSKVGDIMK